MSSGVDDLVARLRDTGLHSAAEAATALEAAQARIAELEAERDRARADALEDAAKVAFAAMLQGSPKSPPSEWDKGYNHACTNIGQRIRALKEPRYD